VNHLLFAFSLTALLLPLTVPDRAARDHRRGAPRAAVGPGAYAAVFAAGVAVVRARTWWYTGVFSLVYGT